MTQADLIWMNGELVAHEDAKVHVLTHALHYGTGVFEGVRAYETTRGTAIFRHLDHIDRLFKSAELYFMEIPFSKQEIRAATHEVIARSGLKSCYIRPLVFRGAGPMGLYPLDCPIEVMIAVWEWGSYLGDEGKANGVRAGVSSWRRIGHDALIPSAKATGQYLNSILAKIEVLNAGYDEAVMLTEHGHVAEGSGENIFAARNGVLMTPPPSDGVLEGITRNIVMQFAASEGIELRERTLTRSDLVIADELFYTGTAAEIVPIRELDDHLIGEPGPVTRRMQERFRALTEGRDEEFGAYMEYARK